MPNLNPDLTLKPHWSFVSKTKMFSDFRNVLSPYAGQLWVVLTKIEVCTDMHSHKHTLFPRGWGGVNWTLEKQLYPPHAECLSQLNKHCTKPRFTLPQELYTHHTHRHTHTHTHALTCTRTIHSPKVCPCFSGSFTKALSLWSLSPLTVLPKLSDGSYRVDAYLDPHLLLLEKGFTQPTRPASGAFSASPHLKLFKSNWHDVLYSQVVQIDMNLFTSYVFVSTPQASLSFSHISASLPVSSLHPPRSSSWLGLLAQTPLWVGSDLVVMVTQISGVLGH